MNSVPCVPVERLQRPVAIAPTPAAPIRVLLVDNDRVEAQSMIDVLSNVPSPGFVVRHETRLAPALEHLRTAGADIVLLDLELPDSSGLETCERARRGATSTPIVIISGIDDERLESGAVRCGAQDYLVKGRLDGELLTRVMRHAIERTRGEQALRHERDRAQRYLDTADVILMALDVDGRITLINRKGCDLLGWTERELLGRDWIETCVPPRLHAGPRDMDRRPLDGHLAVVESSVRSRSGEERLIEWRNTVLRDDAGDVVGTFRSGADITVRRRAEEIQRASDARYETLFESAPDGIVIADRESRYIDANPSVCRMLGYSRDELIGLHASDIVTAAEVSRIAPALREIATTPRYEREWQFRRKDGTVFAADVSVTAMPDGNLLAMIRDVTERNRAVEAVRAAEERMRFALENANVGIWDMDYATGVLTWSTTLEAHYGLPPGTFGGTFDAFVELVHPADRAGLLDAVGTAMAAGSDFSVLNRAVWPDGTVRWLGGTGRVLLDSHGKPARGVGISLDVTERHNLEAQFQQAQKMEAVGRLAGGVAHDFNNLLTVILGFCGILVEDLPADDPHQTDIAEIHKAGTQAAGLTRQLLAFSRKQVIEPTVLDLNVVMTEMQAMLGRLIGEDVRVVMALRPGLPKVRADRGQLQQIVMNLAVNARDSMPKGGTLTIETASVELDEHDIRWQLATKPGAYVVLTVSDTGTGMTAEVQARLFEPFFTTKGPGKGTGLGLATVHAIAGQNNGRVSVYSEVGKGTSVMVYLPEAGAGLTAAPPLPVRHPGGTETVLVVEDAEALRDLTRKLLQRLGYTVLTAANASEAVELFAQQPLIDVILTDVVMPGASGPDLIKELVAQRLGLKVVYMSGYTQEAIAHHGLLRPGIVFLHKPFTSETLGRKIRQALD